MYFVLINANCFACAADFLRGLENVEAGAAS